ncbi:transposase [Nonomuraea angiospora]|uniref:RNA-guided endonuclease InsQ/TnpB family protein n=1 Tax=Nonomuraea angiospora TaxID=46172 RepID=UPI0033F9760E
MLTGRKHLLDLTPEQAAFAERISGACRAVWNTALEQRRSYRRREAFIGYHEQARRLVEAKREPELEWLAEVPGHCLQQTLIDLDAACTRHGTWRVRWKSKTRTRPSFRFPEGGKITVERLNRRRRAARRVEAFAAKIRGRRADFAAKTAHMPTRDHDLIVFEALKIKSMTATVAPKPDPERPGTFLPNRAAAKSGLNRAILDKGWQRIELAVRSKARYTGTFVITVNPVNTSITCHECKHVEAKSRKSQAVFVCALCGHRDHADVNAAKNILTAGRAELAQARPAARVGARKPRSRVGRKANRQATAVRDIATASPSLAEIPRH